MQDETKIQALLQSNAPENQKIAIQLIQSQWGWTLEKAFDYAIDFYCKTSANTLFLYLGNIILSYTIVDHEESHYRWDTYVVFKMEEDKIVKKEEEFGRTNIGRDQYMALSDYVWNIKTHFKQLLPTISQD